LKRITVDASKLRQAPPILTVNDISVGMLAYPRSECGCIVGVFLAACGVPVDERVCEPVYEGHFWPAVLPEVWRTDWVHERGGLLCQVAELFDTGHERAAAELLRDACAAEAGVELAFENWPDEIPVFNAATDKTQAAA
jgi:hypothetical protein